MDEGKGEVTHSTASHHLLSVRKSGAIRSFGVAVVDLKLTLAPDPDLIVHKQSFRRVTIGDVSDFSHHREDSIDLIGPLVAEHHLEDLDDIAV